MFDQSEMPGQDVIDRLMLRIQNRARVAGALDLDLDAEVKRFIAELSVDEMDKLAALRDLLATFGEAVPPGFAN